MTHKIQDKIKAEHAELMKLIAHLDNILNDEACILSLGKKICKTPSLNFILRSTTSL